MALITCPECGNQFSDKAKACVHCGAPIEAITPSGTVRIKLTPVRTGALNGKQKVTIFYGKTWRGMAGDVAEIYFERATTITVQYHTSVMHYGGKCTGTIDPAKSRKYNVSARPSAFHTILTISAVDVFDSD